MDPALAPARTVATASVTPTVLRGSSTGSSYFSNSNPSASASASMGTPPRGTAATTQVSHPDFWTGQNSFEFQNSGSQNLKFDQNQ